MKFKMQVSPEPEMAEKLEDVIDELKEQGVLTEYEFQGKVNYKSRKDIPVSLGGGGGGAVASPPTAGGSKNSALNDLVIALAEASDDPKVEEALQAYKDSL